MIHAVRVTAITAAVLVSTVLATGGTALAAPTGSHHRATLRVHTTSRHTVAGPRSARPGVARFTNTGEQAIFLVTPRHGAGTATLARDLNASKAAGLLKHFVVADTLPGRETTYLRLARGTYYLADISTETFRAARIASLHVAGSTVNATVPVARVIVATSHNTVTGPTSISATSELRVRNASSHLQEVFLWAVRKDVTDSQLQAFVAKPETNKLFEIAQADLAPLAILSPHLRATSSRHATAGRYLLVAFPIKAKTYELHLAAGQVRLVNVT